MKTHSNRAELAAVLALGLAFGAAQTFAGPIQVTILDNSPTAWGFTGDAGGPSSSGNAGIAKEDNEVERPALATQEWDLEAFVVNGSTLQFVGGYDLLNGLAGGRPGDLFIKVGGSKPSSLPTTSTGNVANSVYGYTYAIDLSISAPSYSAVSFGATVNAFALSGGSTLNTVSNDFLGSNPWKYANNGTATLAATLPVSYQTGLSSSTINTLTGLALNLQGTSHNLLTLDLSLLGPLGSSVWLSYTMECGNDSIKGHVPESGASAILLGLGLSVLSVLRLRRRQVA